MEYLAHHGILGQRWGVRRFQNPDGSLTPEGRQRYGVETIAKGSSVRRITGVNQTGSENPLGMYTYGEKSESRYLKSVKQLPSVNPTYASNNTKYKVTQYEFVRDAKLLPGKDAVRAYMDQLKDVPYSVFLNDFNGSYDDTGLHSKAQAFIDAHTFETIGQAYKAASKDSIDTGRQFANKVIGGTFYMSDITTPNKKQYLSYGEQFISKFKNAGYDVIIDPEDFTGGFDDPYFILNRDVIKEVGHYKDRVK